MTSQCELLIMRHAKSDWNSAVADDFSRPLNPRGRKAAPRMGRWLSEKQLLPDQIISSPARRTTQTAQLVAGELGYPPDEIIWQPEIYEASLDALLGVVAACPQASRRVLIIGHNPGLERLVRCLAAQITEPGDANLMPSAALAVLELHAGWDELTPGSAHLRQLLRVTDLPE